ncbi:MAG: SsrA-binding protein SmpB [Holophagae bacterium]|jgi:SsrA-binding protein
MTDERRIIAQNRRARHLYHLLDREVAGIELLGTEVKAIRDGRVNLTDAHVQFVGGQAILVGCHIGPYEHGGYASHEPRRPRRLLMHKRQIERLAGKVSEKGLTVVPTAIVVVGNWIKVEIALARGKQLHDKRETLRRRTLEREAEQALKERH